jgi:serine/threonine protein kinase
MSEPAIRRAPSQPERLGRYEVLRQIACGAMGVVYLGRLQSVGGFERMVAIKVLHPHLARKPQIVNMLLTEARLAAQIQHPNVVSVLDMEVTESGEHYVVMDYIDGFTLCDLLDHPRLDALRRVRLGLRVLLDATLGLDAAHRLCSPSDGSPLRIVHRDVSPNNILCSLQGMGLIADFGIARVAAQDTDSMPGVVKGTPCYMAPEQVSGSEDLDARADVWSLGAVLWEVLTGEQLFYSPNGVGGVFSLVLTGEIPAPSERNSRVQPALDVICRKALTRDPANRYQSARELAEDLKRVAREHDVVASQHEAAETLAQLFAEQIEQRRSWLPAASPAADTSADPSSTRNRSPVPSQSQNPSQSPIHNPSQSQGQIQNQSPTGVERVAFDSLRALAAEAGEQIDDSELERLRLRRPPWLWFALAAGAVAAAAALLLADAERTPPRMHIESETPRAQPGTGSTSRLLLDLEPPDETADGSRPATRNLAFAPSRSRLVTPRAPRAGGGGAHAHDAAAARDLVLEPNPYLQR